MNPVICFIGIDGSGKTTLCKLLVKELKSHGKPSRYVYGRFLPKLMAPAFKMVSTLASDGGKTPNDHNTRLARNTRLLSNPLTSRVFIAGVLFDQILQVFFNVYLPSAFKKEIVVCDRYFYDTVLIDIAIPCGFSYDSTVRFVRRYLPLFPKIHTVFLVVVPPRIAFERKKDISSMKALERLSESYLNMARQFGATTIDGTRNLSELMPMLLSKLESSGISLNN